MMTTLKSAVTASVATITLATMLATSAAWAVPLSFQPLLLLNGWTTYSPDVRAPKVAVDQDNVVHFIGGVKQTGASNSHVFTLAAQFRPNKIVYAVTDNCGGGAGRFRIEPDGDVHVSADLAFADAKCFTSLEGVSFPR